MCVKRLLLRCEVQPQSAGVVTSLSPALLFLLLCCLCCRIWLEVQKLHQQMQPEGKKLSLLSLMEVLHNLVTTVTKTITLRLMSNPVTVSEGQSLNCHLHQMSSFTSTAPQEVLTVLLLACARVISISGGDSAPHLSLRALLSHQQGVYS